MKAKLLSFLLACSMLFSLLPATAFASELPTDDIPSSQTVWEGSALAYVSNPYATTPRPIDSVQLYQNIFAGASCYIENCILNWNYTGEASTPDGTVYYVTNGVAQP